MNFTELLLQSLGYSKDHYKLLPFMKEAYETIVHAYANEFANKHQYSDYDKDMWVANQVGGILMIGDMFVGFDQIRYDIDNQIDPDVFDRWYWDALEAHELGLDYPNYENYTKGAPTPSKETIEHIKSMRVQLENLIEDENKKLK